MDLKSSEKLELNKILCACAEYASLDGGKKLILDCLPSSDLTEVKRRLALTRECDRLLFTYGVGGVQHFTEDGDVLKRAEKGAALSCGELLNTAALLRSARCVYNDIEKCDDVEIKLIKQLAVNIYFDKNLEDDIFEKIISVDAVADNASERLYSIRSKIKSLNSKIRSTLAEYSAGKDAEFLQEGIVTMRNDRYVVPVKSEYKNRVKGFVHDLSKTGATFFIEPEYVLELNNELIALTLDEREEVEAILKALSVRVGKIAQKLITTCGILCEIDSLYARAEFCYRLKCVEPSVNDKGYINIIKGRHPLINAKKVVPVSLELGKNYDFLLLSGANTGGKTVTLKMTGLFCLMAACGLFIPAAQGSSVAVFNGIFCDVGDSQSIEESLSTFSSHIVTVNEICRNADKKSLVLIDELGGGTNPDEGQAIAKAVVKHLLDCGAKGIVTTHFTPLKEFAYTVEGIENASMEFDMKTFMPLYAMKTGLPGASNALAISRRLGMDEAILKNAENYLSEGAKSFENVMRRAEESRLEAQKKLEEISAMQREWREKLDGLDKQIEQVNREKEKINRLARAESRRIINERTERAEEMLSEIEEIFKKEEITQNELIRARTLKNKLKDAAFDDEEDIKKPDEYAVATAENLKVGGTVFIKPMECRGQVVGISPKKGEAEILCGSIRTHLKFKDLLIVSEQKTKPQNVKVVKKLPKSQPVLEINVLGMTVIEALYEVDNFIDRAVTDNLEEIKVIHGVGTGKLKSAIAEHLKRHKNVESYRAGKYGEGETGVTFIKLK